MDRFFGVIGHALVHRGVANVEDWDRRSFPNLHWNQVSTAMPKGPGWIVEGKLWALPHLEHFFSSSGAPGVCDEQSSGTGTEVLLHLG